MAICHQSLRESVVIKLQGCLQGCFQAPGPLTISSSFVCLQDGTDISCEPEVRESMRHFKYYLASFVHENKLQQFVKLWPFLFQIGEMHHYLLRNIWKFNCFGVIKAPKFSLFFASSQVSLQPLLDLECLTYFFTDFYMIQHCLAQIYTWQQNVWHQLLLQKWCCL